jgi:protein-disulfide isomerase
MSEDEKMNITFKKSSAWKLATFIFAGLLIISVFTSGFGYEGKTTVNTGNVGAGNAPAAGNAPSDNVKVQINKGDHILGDAGADISVIEFSDFQCSFCSRAYTGAVTELKNSDLFKDGEINFIYKHFPLNSIHPEAQKAAEATECAADQDKFWEMHDIIFENQRTLDIASLKGFAGQLGLNQGDFDSCLDNGDKAGKVNADLAEASAAGGRGTPYFVVYNKKTGDSVPVSGAVPFAQIQGAIGSVQ